MKTVICESSQLALKTAEHIRLLLDKKPDAVVALSAGRTMSGLWQRLGEMCSAGEISFHSARILLTAELIDADENLSCRHTLEAGLLDNIDVDRSNCFFPDASCPEAYDELIDKLGGIDLAVLGIGENCHIGYNEPGTFFDTRTRVQKLTDRTKRQLKERGFSDENMPEEAVTMGIKTLTSARDIMLIAEGEDKSSAVFQMVYSKTMPYIPASFLQIPLEVTAYLDTAAADQL